MTDSKLSPGLWAKLGKYLAPAIGAIIIPTAANAQAVPLHGGPWVSGHAPMYTNGGQSQQPVLQDSGPAAGGKPGLGLVEQLLVERGTGAPPYANAGTGPFNTNFCDYDAPITSAGGYHYICMSPNAQGGALLAVGSGGGAPQLPLSIMVNGISYPFPSPTLFGLPARIEQYGAISGDPTAAAVNTAAWNKALAASSEVLCQPGKTYYVNSPIVPLATTTRIAGACTLIPGPNFTQGSGVLNFSNSTSGLTIDGLRIPAQITVLSTSGTTHGTTSVTALASTAGVTAGMVASGADLPTGTTVVSVGSGTAVLSQAANASNTETITFSQPFDAIQFGGSANVNITNTVLSGRYCILAANSDYVNIVNNVCSSYAAAGIENDLTTSSHFYENIQGNTVTGPGASATAAIIQNGGNNVTLTGNKTFGSQVHGVTISGITNPVKNFTVSDNEVYCSHNEALYASGTLTNGTIHHNSLYLVGCSFDNGISVDSSGGFTISDVIVDGNVISGSGATGIFVGETGGGGSLAVRVKVTGNKILNPYSSTTDSLEGAILVVGLGAQVVTVNNNDFLNATGNMKWQALEVAGVDGNPSSNTFGPNNGAPGTSGYASVIGTGSSILSAPIAETAMTTNQFMTYIDAGGLAHKAQPSASNLSDGLTGTGAVVKANAPAITSPTVAGTFGLASRIVMSNTAPVATTFCTSPTVNSSNGTAAFTIGVGSACATSVGTITMPAATGGWACHFSDITNPAANAPAETGTTTTTVSLTNYSRTTGAAANWTSGDIILAECLAF